MKQQFLRLSLFLGVLLITLAIAVMRSQPDGYLHVVFCDVGQGDAIYIKTPQGDDILIDGGPNQNVLTCLGNNMAFWDRQIELIILTHPQYDHFNGLIDVIQRYQIGRILLPPPDNDAESFQVFKDAIHKNNIPLQNVYSGETISIANSNEKALSFSILWPEYKWVADRIAVSNQINSLTGRKVLGVATTHDDLNDFSIVATLHYKLFDVLLTGDAESDIIGALGEDGLILSDHIEVIKVGHHGAEAGLSHEMTNHIKPDLAVISVGKNNRYDHPRPEVLEILDANKVPVKRTDRDGEIEIVSDGERWWLNE